MGRCTMGMREGFIVEGDFSLVWSDCFLSSVSFLLTPWLIVSLSPHVSLGLLLPITPFLSPCPTFPVSLAPLLRSPPLYPLALMFPSFFLSPCSSMLLASTLPIATLNTYKKKATNFPLMILLLDFNSPKKQTRTAAFINTLF